MPRVLVIDDQAHVRATLLITLRAIGFEVVGVDNGITGLQEFQTDHFDLAIVDLYMPGIDGVKLIKTMREHAPHFPIIAISGVMLGDSQRTALDFFSDLPSLSKIVCLKKPFRPPELLKAVEAAMMIAA
jgi:CheY-like chemotaxis protein